MLGGPIMAVGADLLLDGETDGMASDFTRSDGTGYVSVLDTATPANVVSNVIGDAWWTNSGTSPKLINTSAGALAWSPHNICLQSQTFGTTWTNTRSTDTADTAVAPDGSMTADSFIEDGTAAQTHSIQQSTLATVSGAQYSFSVYVKIASGTRWIAISPGIASTGAWFDIVNGVVGTAEAATTSSITSVGNGWYLIAQTFTGTGGNITETLYIAEADNDITHNGDSTSGFYLWGAQLNRGAVRTAYLATTTAARYGLGIDYSGGSYGLLVEPAATNVCVRSQEFGSASWTATGVSVASDAVAAPDGTITADTITGDGASSAHALGGAGSSLSTATAYTYSIYAKAGSESYVQLLGGNAVHVDNEVYANFDLVGGVVGTKGTSTTTSSIEALANGWYRCSMTATTDAAASGGVNVHIATSSSMGRGATTTASGTLHLWGAQLETGTVATSHIPTFAATVTRSADSITAASTTFNLGTSYSVYHRSTILALGSGSLAVIAAVDNGTANERAVDYSEGGKWKYVVTDGGATQALQDTALTAPTLGTAFKAGWRAAANSFNHAIDGVVDTVDAAGTMPTATTIRLGYTAISAGAQGPVRTHYVVHLPRAMTDLELDAATT
jgi:hypothetical protein